ncbi:hypothetical protein BpHYR1_006277 [Brachionus plicatilis]|uniref:Transmembrane protein n=1 Tax=Brachionus plicatilis TaxID=10195 RepID=A0A3M7RC67_BRAPC|nr:hypothetical protein BpHYR1_006277 [Brachionus plicatilis]
MSVKMSLNQQAYLNINRRKSHVFVKFLNLILIFFVYSRVNLILSKWFFNWNIRTFKNKSMKLLEMIEIIFNIQDKI